MENGKRNGLADISILRRDEILAAETPEGQRQFTSSIVINCAGIQSPGLTSSLAIADMVPDIINTELIPLKK